MEKSFANIWKDWYTGIPLTLITSRMEEETSDDLWYQVGYMWNRYRKRSEAWTVMMIVFTFFSTYYISLSIPPKIIKLFFYNN